jgi:hypothetical protein
MGFQSATLQFSRNGDASVAEWRQDLAVNDVVTVSLTDNVGANSYIWRLVGRPEGSAAGGPGPEPRYLGTAQVASFTVDVVGTYIVQCIVNGGAPDALAIGGGVAILESFLAPGNRPLRLLGPGESNEDVFDPMVVQGWIKMLNRWLTKIRAGGGTTDTFKVMSDMYDDDPQYLFGKVESTDGSVTITDDVAGKRVNFAVLAKPAPNLTKRYYLTGQGSDLARADPGDPQTGYLLSLTNPSDEAHALDVGHPGASPLYLWFDSPPGEPGLASWPSGIVTGNLRVRVRNAHGGMTYKLYPGDNSIAYETMLYDATGGYFYQMSPWPSAPVLSSSYQTFQLPLYVTGLSGSSSRRLRADLILQVSGGSITDEVFEVRCGGDNASWFDTLFTPSGNPTGASDHKVSVDAGDIADYLFAKLSAGTNITITKAGSEPHETVQIAAAPGGTSDSVESTDGSITVTNVGGGVQNIELPVSTALPTTDSGMGSAGTSLRKSNDDHQHAAQPIPSLTKRYYLTGQGSDLPRAAPGDPQTGYLLATTNPSDEAHAADVGHPGTSPSYIWFDSPPGEPGLTSWPAGLVLANLRVRVRNAHGGLTYHLYPGDNTIAYEAMLYDVTNGLFYQSTPWPSAPTLSSSYQTFQLPIYVQGLSGTSARRLRADLILRVTGGSLTDEVFEVRCGGDNASYFDTLFVGSGGGAADHQALYNRGTFLTPANAPLLAHPMSDIEPPDPVAVTTVSGFLTLPSNYMTVVQLRGTEPLFGISARDGYYSSVPLILFILEASDTYPSNPDFGSFRTIINCGDMTGHPGFYRIDLGMMGMGAASGDNPPPNLDLPQYSCFQLICMGGVWRPVAPAFVFNHQ